MLLKLALSITSFIPLYSLMIFMYVYQFLYGNIDSSTKKYVIIAISIIMIVQLIFSIIASKYIYDKENTRNTENEIIFHNIKEDKKAAAPQEIFPPGIETQEELEALKARLRE